MSEFGVILLADHSRGFGAPGGARFGFVSQRDPIDGSPSPGPKSVGYLEPGNWRLDDLGGRTLEGVEDRRVAVRLVSDPSPVFDVRNRSTRVIDAAGREAMLSTLAVVVSGPEKRSALALRLSGAQVDPGLAVSFLLRQGWRPASVAASGEAADAQ